jgi:hypothetical protein
MATERFSLAEVVKRTGAKRRAIQLWADGGVILATPETDRAGTGHHRTFEPQEVQIAAILAPLAQLQISIGVLKRFAGVLRQALAVRQPGGVPAYFEAGAAEIGHALVRAAHGQGSNWLMFTHSPEALVLSVVTDEEAPISVDFKGFVPPEFDPRSIILTINLTATLGGLLN